MPSFYELYLNVGLLFWLFMMIMVISNPFLTYARRKRVVKAPKEFPSVSILRPMKGLDSNLESNLRSSFEQTYPNFEIICSVENDNDPALQVFLKLQKEYPKVKSQIIIGIDEVGINPKINNLIKSYRTSRSDLLWLLDSNVYVTKDVLVNSVVYFEDPEIGIVHHVPGAFEFDSIAAYMEGVYLNTYHNRIYTFFNAINVPSTLIGKSNIFRKRDIETCGGLAQFGKYLGEDFMTAVALWKIGKKKVMGTDFIFQSVGKVSNWDFAQRRIRWARIRKQLNLVTTILEPYTQCFFNSINIGLYFNYYFGLSTSLVALTSATVCFSVDMLATKQIYDSIGLGMDILFMFKYTLAWFLLELTAYPLYAWGLCGSTIQWRDKIYILRVNGTVETIKGHSKQD